MNIGEVIRKYRKEAGITQEEMAKRLGVTTPAVNKWENNNSQPDIALLAPIARLLNITTDTLLSFREDLTEAEIANFTRKLSQDLEKKEYREVFAEAEKMIGQYPNCFALIWQAAVILEARMVVTGTSVEDDYEETILDWYERCLACSDERIRNQAAGCLFHAYERKGEYAKALEYAGQLSREDPMRKRMEAIVFSKTDRREEAYRTFEEMLFADCQRIQLVLNDLRMLYQEDGDHVMAHKLVNVASRAAAAFEMGRYSEVSTGLDVAAWEQDAAWTEKIMRELLENIETIGSFAESDLYRHLSFTKPSEEYYRKIRQDIISSMTDEAYSYMRGNHFWEEMLKKGVDSPLRSEDTLSSDPDQKK